MGTATEARSLVAYRHALLSSELATLRWAKGGKKRPSTRSAERNCEPSAAIKVVLSSDLPYVTRVMQATTTTSQRPSCFEGA
jgi:hypothetical protein